MSAETKQPWDREELNADLQKLLLELADTRPRHMSSIKSVGTSSASTVTAPDGERLSEEAKKLVAMGCPAEIAVLPERGMGHALLTMNALMPKRPVLSRESLCHKADALARRKVKYAAEYAREEARAEELRLALTEAASLSPSPSPDG